MTNQIVSDTEKYLEPFNHVQKISWSSFKIVPYKMCLEIIYEDH